MIFFSKIKIIHYYNKQKSKFNRNSKQKIELIRYWKFHEVLNENDVVVKLPHNHIAALFRYVNSNHVSHLWL